MKIVLQSKNTIIVFLIAVLATSCLNMTDQSNSDNEVSEEHVTDQNLPDVSYSKELTDVALFISGLAIDSASHLFDLTQKTNWISYSAKMDKQWSLFFNEVDSHITPWVQSEIGNLSDSLNTLFYPFSGPDFINANIFFPDFSNYLFFGLEPPGSLPDPHTVESANLTDYYKMYEQSIYHIIHLSFFRTHSMRDDLSSMEVDGALPVIMIFLARANKKIIDIQPFRFSDDGSLTYDSLFNNFRPGEKFKKGIEITFRNENDPRVQKLVYFSIDISDGYLSRNADVMNYLNNIDSSAAVYIKSASYLLHDPYFNTIRNILLDKASLILQDDSGIPYKYFDREQWNIQLYGVYDRPISLFSKYYQKALFDDYAATENTELKFRRGYARKTNLLLANRKK